MTIGFFDGVHRGHQKIIRHCVKKAARTAGTSVALTFDQPPINILKNRIKKKLILEYEDKIGIIKDLGIDVIVTAKIKKDFLGLSPEGFCENILIGLFNIRYLYIGTGFRFGKGAAGDISLLRDYLGRNGAEVNEVGLVRSRGEAISSTVIRKHYSLGNIRRIKQLLGRDPYVKGRVARGSGRGKKLGIPTVNIDTGRKLILPRDGVYVGTVSDIQNNGPGMPAVINIGDNPTFGDNQKRIESHILDFEGDMYGRLIKIDFLDRLREEIKFDSTEELKKQIQKDIGRGRYYFR